MSSCIKCGVVQTCAPVICKGCYDDLTTQLAAAEERLNKIDKLCLAFRDSASGLADMFARDVMAISGPQGKGGLKCLE